MPCGQMQAAYQGGGAAPDCSKATDWLLTKIKTETTMNGAARRSLVTWTSSGDKGQMVRVQERLEENSYQGIQLRLRTLSRKFALKENTHQGEFILFLL